MIHFLSQLLRSSTSLGFANPCIFPRVKLNQFGFGCPRFHALSARHDWLTFVLSVMTGRSVLATLNVILLLFFFFASKEPSLTVGDVTYRLFDRVLVKINVNTSSTENKFLSFSLMSKKVR